MTSISPFTSSLRCELTFRYFNARFAKHESNGKLDSKSCRHPPPPYSLLVARQTPKDTAKEDSRSRENDCDASTMSPSRDEGRPGRSQAFAFVRPWKTLKQNILISLTNDTQRLHLSREGHVQGSCYSMVTAGSCCYRSSLSLSPLEDERSSEGTSKSSTQAATLDTQLHPRAFFEPNTRTKVKLALAVFSRRLERPTPYTNFSSLFYSIKAKRRV